MLGLLLRKNMFSQVGKVNLPGMVQHYIFGVN